MSIKVHQLVDDVHAGRVVLPDFQRTFIWEPEDIRELLVSVLGDYFIGSMLVLEQYSGDCPFAFRLIEGVEKVNPSAKAESIVKIILDGQQRTTALFYAVYEPDIPLKNRKSSYRFYLRLNEALDRKWDEAVVAVSTRDKRELGQLEAGANVIPFKLLKNIEALAKEFQNDQRLPSIIALANAFLQREIHVVTLSRETDMEKIVETFERINRTGEALSVFELLAARLYKSEIKLRDLLEEAKTNFHFVKFIPPESILKVIALLRGVEPKRKNILELDPNQFKEYWDRSCNSLEKAYKRVTDLRDGYGVLDIKKWMPYTTMIVPLAATIDFLGASNMDSEARSYDKVDCWYWAAVFSNRYEKSADTVAHNDFNALKSWIRDESKVPNFIQKFQPDALDFDTDKQSSALYRGVISLVVLSGALDFKTGQPPQFSQESVQDDHIFPKSRYHDSAHVDSVLNRTLISTNQSKSDKAPPEYFKERLEEHGRERLREILRSHLIAEDALQHLLGDNLEKFRESRKNAIVAEIRRRLAKIRR